MSGVFTHRIGVFAGSAPPPPGGQNEFMIFTATDAVYVTTSTSTEEYPIPGDSYLTET